ncbi:MAG: hypothetical protein J5879_03085 [Clostridia bacterium]|nr:hypothetical protein [Clostridia bacterium]
MYAQRYKQPPKDYGGTAMQPPEAEPETGAETRFAPEEGAGLLSRAGTDEMIIAIVIFLVMSGGWDKNTLLLLALVFILL